MAAARLLLLLAALALPGCAAIGPRKVSVDRGDYVSQLRESEKSQLLSNVVAMRYGDAPLFLGVTSVISQYTREQSGRMDLTIAPPVDSADGVIGGSMLFRETPTVTYSPMSGERFSRSMLSPIPPASLLAMMESGWAADRVFAIAVRSINGVGNASHTPLFEQPGDPRFDDMAAAFRRLQRSGAISIRMQERDKVYTALGRISPTLTDKDRADLAQLKAVLRLPLDGDEMRIVFTSQPTPSKEVGIVTRSVFEILGEMSQCVDLTGEGVFPQNALIRVHSGNRPPADAYVSTLRRGRWYWIDGDDAASKQVFLLVQVMIQLSDDGSAANAPLVSIPAGG